MDDAGAHAAYRAYQLLLASYLNPSIAPELLEIMKNLREAVTYLDSIPLDRITPEQEKLAAKIDALLLGG